MPDLVTPLRALLSVTDKAGVVDLARALADHGVELVSTGGTARVLADAGLAVREVAELTGFPEMMDGRVKTLHPMVHGGLLADREAASHTDAMAAHGIPAIDILVVNLYAFAATVASGARPGTVIENIDIGGPAMIRSAAKNHAHVAVVTDPADYAPLLAELAAHGGTTLATRRRLAAKAYAATAAYDSAIAGWFADQADELFPPRLTLALERLDTLRYGENPHQQAAVYALPGEQPGVAQARQVQGKPLSYNNLNDADASLDLIAHLPAHTPAVAIIKHANPCGVALGGTLAQAYAHALAGDPVSAFGGIVALNGQLDGATAQAVAAIFTEVVIAPDADADALAIFARKPNLRLLLTGALPDPALPARVYRSIIGGVLAQTRDAATAPALTVVTQRPPTTAELADLRFAWTVAKAVKSNAVVFVKDGVAAGIGAGQMSRLDSTRIAARKAEDAALAAGWPAPRTQGSVVASDAFFPFADGLLACAEAGATAVIQPGGSMRDAEVIAAANARGLAMVFTGVRHFRH